jgi:DNA-binding response OmpR family regulator
LNISPSQATLGAVSACLREILSEAPLVLIVEDEYLLHRDIEEALTDGGFAVEAAFSGEEALTLMMGGTKTYRALVTDVRLGSRLTGWDVARRIREKEPAFPVVYLTAANSEDWAAYGVPNSILVSKPFAPAQLVTAVSQLLNAGGEPTAPA